MDVDKQSDLDAMVEAYLDCALWSSTDFGDEEGNDPRPLDEDHGADDITDDTRREAAEDCSAFAADNAADLASMDPYQAGHDFWLTRNHHGAGFWDRGLGEAGDRLTKAAHVYGSVDLYVTDDGKVSA